MDKYQRIKELINEYKIEVMFAGCILVLGAIIFGVLISRGAGKDVVVSTNSVSGSVANISTETVSEDSANTSLAYDISAEVDDGVTLLYDADMTESYLQNCIFLGDSRIVGMAQQGYIETNTALAQIGLTHTNAQYVTYDTADGKSYTFSSYLKSHQADVVIICYGVNGLTMNEETYKSSYVALVEEVIKLEPDSAIVLQAIWPVEDDGRYSATVSNKKIDEYNIFLYELAKEKGLYYLNTSVALKDTDGTMKDKYDSGDGLHYSKEAYVDIIDYIVHHPVPGVVPHSNGFTKEQFVWVNPSSVEVGAADISSVSGDEALDMAVSDNSVSDKQSKDSDKQGEASKSDMLDENSDKEKLDKDKDKLDKEEAEKLEKERLEKEEAEKLEKERLEKEEAEKLEKERLEKEEAEKLEKERLEKEASEKLEKERLEKEKLEAEQKEATESGQTGSSQESEQNPSAPEKNQDDNHSSDNISQATDDKISETSGEAN